MSLTRPLVILLLLAPATKRRAMTSSAALFLYGGRAAWSVTLARIAVGSLFLGTRQAAQPPDEGAA